MLELKKKDSVSMDKQESLCVCKAQSKKSNLSSDTDGVSSGSAYNDLALLIVSVVAIVIIGMAYAWAVYEQRAGPRPLKFWTELMVNQQVFRWVMVVVLNIMSYAYLLVYFNFLFDKDKGKIFSAYWDDSGRYFLMAGFALVGLTTAIWYLLVGKRKWTQYFKTNVWFSSMATIYMLSLTLWTNNTQCREATEGLPRTYETLAVGAAVVLVTTPFNEYYTVIEKGPDRQLNVERHHPAST
jgi:magnesium-transporting ATPase (P-type)